MKLLCLDGAGDPGYLPPLGKSEGKYYVLGGLAVDDNKYFDAYIQLNEIKKEFDIMDVKELKYADIHNKKKPFDKLSDQSREELANRIFMLIESLDPVLFAIYVNKEKLQQKYPNPERPSILAFNYLISRFSKYLIRTQNTGAIIYDYEEYHLNKKLRQQVINARIFGTSYSPMPIANSRAENIIETIFFVESETSPLIQLADFITRTVFLKLNRNNEKRFNQIYKFFDSAAVSNI
jgi:hypothetical protein